MVPHASYLSLEFQVMRGKMTLGWGSRPARLQAQTAEQDTSHGRTKRDTCNTTYDDTMTQEDSAPSQAVVETHDTSPIMSPRRSKKMKADRTRYTPGIEHDKKRPKDLRRTIQMHPKIWLIHTE